MCVVCVCGRSVFSTLWIKLIKNNPWKVLIPWPMRVFMRILFSMLTLWCCCCVWWIESNENMWRISGMLGCLTISYFCCPFMPFSLSLFLLFTSFSQENKSRTWIFQIVVATETMTAAASVAEPKKNSHSFIFLVLFLFFLLLSKYTWRMEVSKKNHGYVIYWKIHTYSTHSLRPQSLCARFSLSLHLKLFRRILEDFGEPRMCRHIVHFFLFFNVHIQLKIQTHTYSHPKIMMN